MDATRRRKSKTRRNAQKDNRREYAVKAARPFPLPTSSHPSDDGRFPGRRIVIITVAASSAGAAAHSSSSSEPGMSTVEKINLLLSERRWKQTDLARAASVSKRMISNLFSGVGSPRVDSAIKIARALGVAADWLFDDAQGWESRTATSGAHGVTISIGGAS